MSLTRLKDTLTQTAISPAFWFPAGNFLLAIDKAEISGMVLMGATTALTSLTKALSVWNKTDSGNHFYILATVNAYLAGSILYNGADMHGLQAMLDFASQNARESWMAAGAMAGWSFCHVINGRLDTIRARLKAEGRESAYNETVKENARNITNDLASMSAVHFNPGQSTAFIAGLIRSLFNKKSHAHADGSVSSFLKKHVTAPRIMAGSYLAGVFANALSNPIFAAAQFCWGTGQITMEPERNGALLDDVRQTFLSPIVENR